MTTTNTLFASASAAAARYHATSYTHNYIIMVEEYGQVNAYFCKFEESDIVALATDLDASRGTLKTRPTTANKFYIRDHSYKSARVCSAAELEEVAKSFGYKRPNRGDAAEKLAAQLIGCEWNSHDSSKYYESGDLVSNGTHYQVKFLGKNAFTWSALSTIANA